MENCKYIPLEKKHKAFLEGHHVLPSESICSICKRRMEINERNKQIIKVQYGDVVTELKALQNKCGGIDNFQFKNKGRVAVAENPKKDNPKSWYYLYFF